MALRLRFLLDTNILIPLQDSFVALEPNLANFVRLAGVGGHQLLYHPASELDIARDRDVTRRARTLERLTQYTRLQAGPVCPWNTPATSVNDACDNQILYALECDAAHALVTEDQKLHAKAKARGLADRAYFIQSAEDWLRRLHESATVRLPKIQDVELHTLTSGLGDQFFDSLREAYPPFDRWFRRKARDGRKAWTYRDEGSFLSAICIYAIQDDETINDKGERLEGAALKLCTFKVGEAVRGRKIGELFLKAAFRFATESHCQNVFIHADPARHSHLIDLLVDFGFEERGAYKGKDRVYVKRHPDAPPPVDVEPFEYVRKFYPHYRSEVEVRKFIIPIKPCYHQILFPDHSIADPTAADSVAASHVGNAIKLAYLSHSPSNQIKPGDIVMFYRTHDEKAITTLGVVERFEVSSSAGEIARLVSRRTVYNDNEIVQMARRPTKVMLFRLIEHLPRTVPYEWLKRNRLVRGRIQSTRAIDDDTFFRIIREAGR